MITIPIIIFNCSSRTIYFVVLREVRAFVCRILEVASVHTMTMHTYMEEVIKGDKWETSCWLGEGGGKFFAI